MTAKSSVDPNIAWVVIRGVEVAGAWIRKVHVREDKWQQGRDRQILSDAVFDERDLLRAQHVRGNGRINGIETGRAHPMAADINAVKALAQVTVRNQHGPDGQHVIVEHADRREAVRPTEVERLVHPDVVRQQRVRVCDGAPIRLPLNGLEEASRCANDVILQGRQRHGNFVGLQIITPGRHFRLGRRRRGDLRLELFIFQSVRRRLRKRKPQVSSTRSSRRSFRRRGK